MKCCICDEETLGRDPVKWGPEFAHRTCVKAFYAGRQDGIETEREACVKAVERTEVLRYGYHGYTALAVQALMIETIRGCARTPLN